MKTADTMIGRTRLRDSVPPESVRGVWYRLVATLIAYWKRSTWAGGLLVLYLAWASFAAALNVAVLAIEFPL